MSFTDVFNKEFPYYLALGMSYEQYWYGDPRLVKAYRKAHELKAQQKNEEMWVQGIYFSRALHSVAEGVMYAVNGGKGKKPSQYPMEPIPFTKAEQDAAEERKRQRALAWVENGQK